MIHLLDYFGITGTGRWYNFWSGSGSDLGELAIVGALFRHVNCHQKGCWRLGHNVNGTVICHRHRVSDHPEDHHQSASPDAP